LRYIFEDYTTPAVPKPKPKDPLDQVITAGSEKDLVKLVQAILVKWNYMEAKYINGNYGSLTKKCVAALQKDLKVSSDGVWGPNTYKAYKKFVDTVKTPGSGYKNQTGRILKNGMTGKDVAEWQFILNVNNGTHHDKWVTVDGDFGPATERATKEFQSTYNIFWDPNIDVDGRVGPQTLKAMEKVLKDKGVWK
jgi:peptidoglycan hydrolase-like protein with peptidoglycan-binding domain